MEIQATQRLKVHFKENALKKCIEKQATHSTPTRIAKRILANLTISQMAI